MMKAISGHLVFGKDVDYKDIARVFPEVLTVFLEETGQMPDDKDILRMFIHLNMVDLERNRKPEGYNRKGKMRLIFPLDRREFYIRSHTRTNELVRIVEKISRILKSSSIEHEVEWNRLYFCK